MNYLLGCHGTFSDNENVWLLSEHAHSFRTNEMVMGTQHCVQAGVLGTLQYVDMCQADVPIQRHVNIISSFLMELKDCHTETHGSLTAICYLVCLSTCLAMSRLESKEHKHYYTDVLKTNPKGIQLSLLLLWQFHCQALELRHTQKKASPFGDVKPDGLVCVH